MKLRFIDVEGMFAWTRSIDINGVIVHSGTLVLTSMENGWCRCCQGGHMVGRVVAVGGGGWFWVGTGWV